MPKTSVGQTYRVSLISDIEKLHASEGCVTIFCLNFCLTVPRKLRRGTVLCCVSEIFRQPKSLWIKEGDSQDFPSKFSCLTVPKTFVGQPYTVSLISGIETFHAPEGCVTTFCANFLSHSAEQIS